MRKIQRCLRRYRSSSGNPGFPVRICGIKTLIHIHANDAGLPFHRKQMIGIIKISALQTAGCCGMPVFIRTGNSAVNCSVAEIRLLGNQFHNVNLPILGPAIGLFIRHHPNCRPHSFCHRKFGAYIKSAVTPACLCFGFDHSRPVHILHTV